MAKDFYAVLALPRNATTHQIRERFRELVKERHPDRFSGGEKERAEREFQEITEAFNVLSHPERRRQHDLGLARPDSAGQQDQVARAYLQRGVRAYRERNYFEAAENFSRVTREEPGNAQGWYYLARALSHQQRWLARATAAISKACELDPINTDYLALAGKLFVAAGMASRGVLYYERALRWSGDDDPEIAAALEEARRASRASGRSGFFGKAR